jgi:3-deoxy-D-manno-octulosonate 8-phosphate phosphatase (KDO 8-P phosphatase)
MRGDAGAGGAAAGSSLSPDLARRIRLVILDVDGVLTDGAIWVGALPGGESLELKRFDVLDGLGIRMLQWAGIQVSFVSGRVSRATEVRARELDIVECHQDGGAQKVRAIRDIMDRLGLEWDQVAMLADDLPDLAVLRRVALPAAVANATGEVRELALWQGEKRGGDGAVREFCEALLKARGEWDGMVEAYVRARDDDGRQG